MSNSSYSVVMTSKFRKDLKRLNKQGKNIAKLKAVVDMLKNEDILPMQYRDHGLIGNYIGYRECHIEPDLLLVYKKEAGILVLTLARTGSHAELF